MCCSPLDVATPHAKQTATPKARVAAHAVRGSLEFKIPRQLLTVALPPCGPENHLSGPGAGVCFTGTPERLHSETAPGAAILSAARSRCKGHGRPERNAWSSFFSCALKFSPRLPNRPVRYPRKPARPGRDPKRPAGPVGCQTCLEGIVWQCSGQYSGAVSRWQCADD